jgi:DNA uptake protein ComE-like DNA-binding protein
MMTAPIETPPGSETPYEPWGFTAAQRYALGIFVSLLIAFLGIQYVRRPARLEPATSRQAALTLPRRMDPNTASALELTRIPNLAEALAQKIIEYREARKAVAEDGIVFRQPEDLTHIVGLKQKTLEQFLPYLEFPADPEEPATAP